MSRDLQVEKRTVTENMYAELTSSDYFSVMQLICVFLHCFLSLCYVRLACSTTLVWCQAFQWIESMIQWTKLSLRRLAFEFKTFLLGHIRRLLVLCWCQIVHCISELELLTCSVRTKEMKRKSMIAYKIVVTFHKKFCLVVTCLLLYTLL